MTDTNDEFEEKILELEGVKQLQVGIGEEDGPRLYVERHDGAGVAVPISIEQYESLERTFMLTDERAKEVQDMLKTHFRY